MKRAALCRLLCFVIDPVPLRSPLTLGCHACCVPAVPWAAGSECCSVGLSLPLSGDREQAVEWKILQVHLKRFHLF